MFSNVYIRVLLLSFILFLECIIPKDVQGSGCLDYCTSIRIRTAMSVLSFMFSAGAFLWVHRENTIITRLTNEAEEAKLRVKQLTQSITSLSNCMGQLVEEHKQTNRVAILMSLEAHSRQHNLLPIFFQYSDPTTYLFKHSKSLPSAKFYPLEVKFIQFEDCDQVHNFFDATYELFSELSSSEYGFEPHLLFQFFDLSLAFCGGYVKDKQFSSEHPCYVVVQAYLKLKDYEKFPLFEDSTNKIISNIGGQNRTTIHLPVMGPKQSVQENIFTYHTHTVWFESFFINNGLKISRAKIR